MSAARPDVAGSRLLLHFGGASVAGAKPVNQDAIAARMPGDQHLRQHKGVALALADGVSSSPRAQEASQTAVLEFLDEYFCTASTLSIGNSAAQVLHAINSWFCGQNRRVLDDGLITTFTAIVVKGRTAHVVHAGDSRAWLVRGNQARALTTDHERRHNGQWVLTRGLGIDPHLELEYSRHALQVGDRLLLTSDGVHRDLGSDALAALIGEADDLEAASAAVVKAALAAGSEDNASCLIGHVAALETESADEAQQRLRTRRIPPVMKPGHRIDHYRVEALLHHSTRSHVYRARCLQGGALRVLKAPSQRFAEDWPYLEGFAREHWLSQQLQHHALLRGYPVPNDSPFLYSVFEHLEGISLRQWMRDHPVPSLAEARDMARLLVDGLRALQRQGVVHRDFKPENVLITRNSELGSACIIDYGTAQIDGLAELPTAIEESVPMGSVGYIAPEYLLGDTVDWRADQFALGCVLYELLSGHLPYDMERSRYQQPSSLADWHYRPIRKFRPDLPSWLDSALRKACAPDPAQRYAAYSEFLQDLTQAGDAAKSAERRQPWIEREPVRVWQGIATILAIALIWVLASGN